VLIRETTKFAWETYHITYGISYQIRETYHIIKKLPEGAPVLLLLEPEGVEVEAEGRSIRVVMSSLNRTIIISQEM